MNQDAEHLRLLSIFHYVVAGVGTLFSCFPVFHLAFGLVMLFAPDALGQPSRPNDAEALRLVGIVMTTAATAFILIGWTISFCVFLAGRYLARRQHYTFCLVMAAILCMIMPLGTVLGVFSIIVLIRPSVKALFAEQTANPPAA
jgi:hypothetical protein